jgi:hypothetical protein
VRKVLLAALIACGNTSAGPAAVSTHADASAPAPASTPAVVVGGARVAVSVARTEAERERGLMYVNYLPMDDGMLFIFEEDQLLTFWMKNTLIPLDMIFIRSDLTVAGVVANAKPLTLDTRGVNEPSRYVLEVNGGWAATHGVAAGTKVRFENIP